VTDPEYTHPVTLLWGKRSTNSKWDQVSIWALEHFGLPGNRYVTDISVDQMTWYFRNPQDQLLMITAWGTNHEF
jgi:hypothetical protein